MFFLSSEVFGKLNVVEVVDYYTDSPGLVVAMTEHDEYVLIYRSFDDADTSVDLYIRISTETLNMLRAGDVSVRKILRTGETYRVQTGAVRYSPRKSEVPAKDTTFKWLQEGIPCFSFSPEKVRNRGKVIPWSEVPTMYLDSEIAALQKAEAGGYGLCIRETATLKALQKERALRLDGIEPDPNYWETRDGRRLKISEMTVNHLTNCILRFDQLVMNDFSEKVRANMQAAIISKQDEMVEEIVRDSNSEEAFISCYDPASPATRDAT